MRSCVPVLSTEVGPAREVVRLAFRMRLLPGRQVEYERRHRELWPEMRELLVSHGAVRYTIHLDPDDGSLFGCVDVTDPDLWARVPDSPVCRRWWHSMASLMVVNNDESPWQAPLTEVFDLKERAADEPAGD